jgi:hypothetical protein
LTLGWEKQSGDNDRKEPEDNEIIPFERIADHGSGDLDWLRRGMVDRHIWSPDCQHGGLGVEMRQQAIVPVVGCSPADGTVAASSRCGFSAHAAPTSKLHVSDHSRKRGRWRGSSRTLGLAALVPLARMTYLPPRQPYILDHLTMDDLNKETRMSVARLTLPTERDSMSAIEPNSMSAIEPSRRCAERALFGICLAKSAGIRFARQLKLPALQ